MASRRAVARVSWADHTALSIGLSLTLLSVVPAGCAARLWLPGVLPDRPHQAVPEPPLS
ncbi:sulfatase-maturating enzyme [Streptomyces sp. NBRC 110611]|nr:sulfatase-maturating enzyme [Streptomyces sp. NBRC 110611]